MTSGLQEPAQTSMAPARTDGRSAPADTRLVSEARMREIFTRLQGFARPNSHVTTWFTAGWFGELSWARNRASLASDRRMVEMIVMVQTPRGLGRVHANQFSDADLRAVVRAAEENADKMPGYGIDPFDGMAYRAPLLPYPDTTIWSEATSGVTPDQRAEIARALVEGAETKGMRSAGFLQMRIGEQRTFGGLMEVQNVHLPESGDTIEGTGAARKARVEGYTRHTEAQLSMTVREPKGNGSGWAGVSSYDWATIDGKALADRALDLCLRSLNPVRIEPGRYTVILQPQAVAELVAGTTTNPYVSTLGNRWLGDRFYQEMSGGPFHLDIDPSLGIKRTRLGLKVIDERISIRHDPMHPAQGIIPELGLTPVTWIENGVLRALGHRDQSIEKGTERKNSVEKLRQDVPILSRYAMEMTGGTTTVEDMIRNTKRGLMVTRLSNVAGQDYLSLMHSGITRDGLWLIEDGKITKAVKNMWWRDSPLFVLNQVVDLGVPVPVFRPGENDLRPALMPPLKANDFAFTATGDAV